MKYRVKVCIADDSGECEDEVYSAVIEIADETVPLQARVRKALEQARPSTEE